MEGPVNIAQLRTRIREEVQAKFADLVKNVKAGPGSLDNVARQIGVTRPALTQYARGSVPQSDVLLAAFLKWDWEIRIENPGEAPAWCEFSMSDVHGGIKKRKREPVQLSLFEALTDLNENMDTLKKTVGRVELEIDRAIGRRA